MKRTILFAAATAAAISAPMGAHAITPDETAMIGAIPEHLRPACVPIPPAAPATALVTCDLASTDGVSVTYERFPTHRAASDRYASATAAATANGIPGGGDCTTGLGPTERTYSRASGVAGRVACWTDATGATIVWLDTDAGTVATATRTDGNLAALGAWWAGAGPDVSGRTATDDVGGIFPDPYERRLLRDLPSGATGCVRLSALDRRAERVQASIACRARPTGSVLFIRLANGVLVNGVYGLALANFDVRPRSGGSCSGRPTERAFRTSAGTGGRFMCTVANGRAYLVWKDPATRTLGILVGPGHRMRALFTWWRENGRGLSAAQAAR